MSKQTQWPEYAHTLPELFYEKAAKCPDHETLRAKRDGRWVSITWRELERDVLNIAAALIDFGIEPRGVISLLSTNRPEWVALDFGSTSANILNVPIYPTNTAEQVQFILEDSGAEMIFVEDTSQLEKVLQVRDKLPKLRKAVMIESFQSSDDFVTDLATFMARGAEVLDRELIEQRWKVIDPEDTATLIYTSGTTGNPKGVMLSHRNLVSNIFGIGDFMDIQPGEIDLQFLPICHSFGRMEVYGLMMYQGTVAFAESVQELSNNFKEVRPTIFVTVPRMLEKVYAKINAGLESGSPLKRKLFGWAMGVGKQVVQAKMDNKSVSPAIKLQAAVADKLVFSKIKEALGGRIRILVYAAAPLAVEIQWFFASAGIIALEAYGLTETSPGLTGNHPEGFRLGTVGKPWRDTEVKIAPDGEILARGPQIMLGYWNRPEDTAEALEDGWFHTGDVGEIDKDGFISITDRKKDLIITAGGKNISPQNIENLIKLDESIEQVAIIGDRRKFLTALIVPDFEWLKDYVEEKQIEGGQSEWVKHPDVLVEYDKRLAKANKQLAKYETIKRFSLLPEEFSVDNGMLTPTMKVKRKNVNNVYDEEIENLYADE
ncbi:MAG: long-chain fatty acid--CoA ligase [Candidatus Alcyoniella australis]|nr:long-chain fatty acid--CoA ligase [Candidatus Alcyoniella australis]